MVGHPGPRWQRPLHLIVILSMLLTSISPLASAPRSLAAAPERRYVLPAFDLQSELAGLPAEAPQDLTASAGSAAPVPEVPPEPEPADTGVVPVVLDAKVDPPWPWPGRWSP